MIAICIINTFTNAEQLVFTLKMLTHAVFTAHPIVKYNNIASYVASECTHSSQQPYNYIFRWWEDE